MEIKVTTANTSHIEEIQSLANIAWPIAFRNILSEAQITYMMEMMYSREALIKQLEKHCFYLIEENDKFVGYISLEPNCDGTGKTKIHKIYIVPEAQKRGIGKALINIAMDFSKKYKDCSIFLNVNKNNANAISFYQHLGFEKMGEEIIDIGNGFVMDDYIYEKKTK